MKDLEQLLSLNYKVNGLYSVFFKKDHLDWIYGVFLCLLMETSFLIFMFENNELLFLELAFTDMTLCFSCNSGYCWLHLGLCSGILHLQSYLVKPSAWSAWFYILVSFYLNTLLWLISYNSSKNKEKVIASYRITVNRNWHKLK